MRTTNRALRQLAHALPRDSNTVFVQQFDHSLPAPFASVAQHFQYRLEGGLPVIGEVAKYVYLTAAHVGIDFDAWYEVDIQRGGGFCGLLKSTCGVMIG